MLRLALSTNQSINVIPACICFSYSRGALKLEKLFTGITESFNTLYEIQQVLLYMLSYRNEVLF